MNKENSKPVYPTTADQSPSGAFPTGGINLREYVAIKLRVPDSGINWLDALRRYRWADVMLKAGEEK